MGNFSPVEGHRAGKEGRGSIKGNSNPQAVQKRGQQLLMRGGIDGSPAMGQACSRCYEDSGDLDKVHHQATDILTAGRQLTDT